jgi:ribonuclease HI
LGRQVWGGHFLELDGSKKFIFSWRLGYATNNWVEFLAEFIGLRLDKEEQIKTLVVLGDFEIVIKIIRDQCNKTSIKGN